jgi:hypothetical protein
MSALQADDTLTIEGIVRMMRTRPDLFGPALREHSVKDKSYQDFPMGQAAKRYLASKHKRLTDSTLADRQPLICRGNV